LPTVHDNLGILSGDDIIDGVPRLAQLGARTILVSASWEDSEPVNWLLLAQRLSKEYRVRIVISNLFRGSTILDNGVASDETRTTDFVYTEFVSVPQPLRVKPPIGLPEVPQPTFAPLTESSAQLGRKLFFDPALSRDGTLSCAQCHQPDHSFANNVQVSEGIDNRRGKRNAPSLLNVAYRPLLLWDGRANSLETQLQHVLNSWTEMDNSRENVLRYLNNTPPYPDLFRAAGTSLPISFEAVARSLADFQRTLLSGASPFDHYFYGNLDQSISESAKRGFEVFTGIGGCSSCHAIQKEYALFTDNYVHNTGIGYHPRFEYLGYAGDGREENFATRNVFRGEYVTPSLRNVDLTSPYMHDGSMQTLAEVVEFYDKGGNANPFLDPQIKPLRLDEGQKHDLVEFLKTLTGVTAVQGELR
jgi:cytochrome c peroxidase